MSARHPPHRVRIIGGRWKRTPLSVADVPGLRPTPDRVRETVFNWLGHDLSGLACLDLFAGSGALGFEAASRGASEVWLVETDRRAQREIAALTTRLGATGVRLLATDAQAALAEARARGKRFDLVFLDPPFGRGWLAKVLPLLEPVLARDARIYVESDQALDAAQVQQMLGPSWELLRADRAGQVFYHLLAERNS